MDQTYRKTILALLLTLVMIGSPIATTVGAAQIDADATNSTVTVKETPNVDVWEFAGEPLRADTSNADTVVDIPSSLSAVNKSDNTEQTVRTTHPRNRGVFTAGTTVDFTFRSTSAAPTPNATLNLTSDTTQVHVARLEEDLSEDNVDNANRPDTLGELRDNLTNENVNQNASFRNITGQVNLANVNATPFSFDYTFDESGMYAVMVSRHEAGQQGFNVTDEDRDNFGNISVESNVLIGAVEGVAVQETQATVNNEPSDPAPGDSLTFDVSSGLSGSNINHSVVVYKESTFTGSSVSAGYPGTNSIDESTSLSEFNYTWSIGTVNGVSNISDEVSVLGRTATTDGMLNQRGPTDVTDIVSEIADELNTSEPEGDTGDTTLNASMTAQIDNSDTEITVETFGNWTEGDYRYIYVASTGENSQEFSTTNGTINLAAETNNNNNNNNNNNKNNDLGGGGGGGGGGAGGGGGGGGGDGDDGPPTIEQVESTLNLVEPSTTSRTEVADDDPDTPGTQVTPQETQTVRRISFNTDGLSGNVDVTEYNEPPQTVRDQVAASVAATDATSGTSSSVNVLSVTDITPDNEAAAESSATVTFSVPASAVDNPQQLTVFKETYDFEQQETTWSRLETSTEEVTDEEITVDAQTDSFSLFAVSEVAQQDGGDGQQDGGEQQDDGDQQQGGPSSVLIVVGILALVAVAGAVLYAQQNQNEN